MEKRGIKLVSFVAVTMLTLVLSSVFVSAGGTFDYDTISDSSQWYVCNAYDQLISGYPTDVYSTSYAATYVEGVEVSKAGIRVYDGQLLGEYIPLPAGTTVQLGEGDQGTAGTGTLSGGVQGAIENIDTFLTTIKVAEATLPGQTVNLPSTTYQNALSTSSARSVAFRYLCYKEGVDSAFAECCGLSLGKCYSNTPGKVRRTGNVPETIEEYPCGESIPNRLLTNCVLKIGIPWSPDPNDLYPRYRLQLKNTRSEIYDWTNYQYLEFFINFVESDNLKLLILPTEPTAFDTSGELFNEPIKDYIVNDLNLKRWLHVKIPLYKLTSKSNIRTLYLYEHIDNIPKNRQLIDSQLPNNIFRNIIGIDRIFLSREDQPRFCSAMQYPTWISDLDDNTKDGFNIPYGWLPCASTPGYAWTGTQCCGNDQTDTVNETFVDTLDGCWRGLVVKNDTVVEIGSNLLYLDEMFHACSLPSEKWNMVAGQLTDEKVTQELPGTLMGSWFCDFNYTWKDIDIVDSSSARTKAVALQLLSFSETVSAGDYTLFCDSYENALNDYGYPLNSTWSTDYLTEINNICVLRYGEEVAIGTSINNEIDDSDSFLLAINTTTEKISSNYCDVLTGTGPYYHCSNKDFVFYNKKTKSIIYDKGGIALESTENFIARLIKLIGNALGFYPSPAIIQTADEFDKIYVNKLGNKKINAIMGSDFIKISYYGFTTDICNAADKLRKSTADPPYFDCEFDGTSLYNLSSKRIEALEYWQDLTSKIRLK